MAESLEELVKIGEKYTTGLISDMENYKSHKFCFSKEEKKNLIAATERIVILYGPELRRYEREKGRNVYAFEHPPKVSRLMFEAYTDRDSPKEFKECYEDNYKVMMHIALFHDVVEKGLMKPKGIMDFYNKRRMDGCAIALAVEKMSFPHNASDKVIKQGLAGLQEYPILRYLKFFDIKHNSESRVTEQGLRKMRIYRDWTKGYSPLLSKGTSKVYRYNKDRIFASIKRRGIPRSLMNSISNA